jgi:hypothetical protein
MLEQLLQRIVFWSEAPTLASATVTLRSHSEMRLPTHMESTDRIANES